jgi:hypothetical protein
MCSKQTEIFIRVLPFGYSHIQFDQQKAQRKFGEGQYWSSANFRLRRHAHSSEMIFHSARADRAFGTHVLNKRSDHVDQGSLQIVYDFSHLPYIIAGEFFTKFARGDDLIFVERCYKSSVSAISY